MASPGDSVHEAFPLIKELRFTGDHPKIVDYLQQITEAIKKIPPTPHDRVSLYELMHQFRQNYVALMPIRAPILHWSDFDENNHVQTSNNTYVLDSVWNISSYLTV